MANTLTPTDVYAIVNAMADEMFGKNNTLTAINTQTFSTVGEAMLRSGYDNTINSLSVLIGRTIIAARKYRGKFRIIMQIPQQYGLITRKISFYSHPAEASEDWNTDINGTQLVDGGSVDPWKISKTYPLEINFAGIKTDQLSYTTWAWQLDQAFRSESDFAAFLTGRLTEIANDLESMAEAENKLQVLNAIGATYNVGAARQVVNLTTEYNAFYNDTKTTADLLGPDFDSFMKFFVMRLKGDMALMSERNELFHIYPAKTDDNGNNLSLLRHTPADMRRLLLYMPIIRQAEATVFPSLFDSSYLKIENFEGVEYWANPNFPMSVDVTPNQLDVSTGQSTNGAQVQLDNVVGVLFDRDALATSIEVDRVLTTEMNARGAYFNTVYHMAKDHRLDQTENMIIYFLAD